VTRRSVGVLVRIAVAVALTTYVLYRSSPGAVGAALRGADWSFVVCAIALVLVDRSLMAYRWLLLLGPVLTERPALSHVLRVFFVSTFVGTFLPASIGGDAVRAFALSRHNVPVTASVASVVLDRVLGTIGILLVGAAATAVAPGLVPRWLAWTTVGLAALAIVALTVTVFTRSIADFADRMLRRIPVARVQAAGTGLLGALRSYGDAPSALGSVLAASVAVQVLRVAQAWLLGLALGIAAGPATYLAYIPIILLIMLLPITVNGIGTSQAAFTWLFGAAGVTAHDAFALSVLFVALGVVGNLPGAILYGFGGTWRPARQRVPTGTVDSRIR
jgi:glycosyltransferase 2 family protein